MGYQALLFCPDEKTARTVTQVLSELDFTVVPCTEPFAAVKKLMAEHFDAVVVDCDNEQNATLLFKSARNTAGTQASLAVAVVEGQAGVAKAFRIGANLVLTKPINVDQSKGTLRVARGLLRKGEAKAAAPASPTQPAVSPPTLKAHPEAAPDAPHPAKPAAAFAASAAAGTASAHKSTPEPRIASSISAPEAKIDSALTVEPKPESALRASSAGFGGGTASAPAPAREKAPLPIESKALAVVAEPEIAEKIPANQSTASTKDAAEGSPSKAADGNAESGAKSKKILLALVGALLIAALGFEAWLQWGGPKPNMPVPSHTASPSGAQPLTKVLPAVPSSIPPSAPSQQTEVADTSTPDTSARAGRAQSRQNRITVGTESGKAAAGSITTKASASKAPEQPIVIKNDLSTRNLASSEPPGLSTSGIPGAAGSAPLPKLVGDSNAPVPRLQRVNVSQGVSRGLLVKEVKPTYPPNARQLRLEGAVQLAATISKNGDIATLKVLSGHPIFAKAATDAVKQWKYKPYLLNGEPVEIETEITVKFKLP